jgi:hypothetical protein
LIINISQIKSTKFIYLMTVFSADAVDGGVQTATIDDLIAAELCVTPVFATPSQSSV